MCVAPSILPSGGPGIYGHPGFIDASPKGPKYALQGQGASTRLEASTGSIVKNGAY